MVLLLQLRLLVVLVMTCSFCANREGDGACGCRAVERAAASSPTPPLFFFFLPLLRWMSSYGPTAAAAAAVGDDVVLLHRAPLVLSETHDRGDTMAPPCFFSMLVVVVVMVVAVPGSTSPHTGVVAALLPPPFSVIARVELVATVVNIVDVDTLLVVGPPVFRAFSPPLPQRAKRTFGVLLASSAVYSRRADTIMATPPLPLSDPLVAPAADGGDCGDSCAVAGAAAAAMMMLLLLFTPWAWLRRKDAHAQEGEVVMVNEEKGRITGKAAPPF